ncbi:unnamed protein product, partial [Meganyctiphanes norvegica]
STSSTTSNGSTQGSSSATNNTGNTTTTSRSSNYKTENHINSSRVGLDDFDLTNLTNGRISAYEHYAWEGSDVIPNGSTVGGGGIKGFANSPAHQAKKNNSKSDKKNTPEKTNVSKHQENECSRSNNDQLNNKVASGQQKQQPRRTSYINNNLNASHSNLSSNNNNNDRNDISKNKTAKDDKKNSDESMASNTNGNAGNSSSTSSNNNLKIRGGKGTSNNGSRSERSDRNLRDNAGKTRGASRRKKDASLSHSDILAIECEVVMNLWQEGIDMFVEYLFNVNLGVEVLIKNFFAEFITLFLKFSPSTIQPVDNHTCKFFHKYKPINKKCHQGLQKVKKGHQKPPMFTEGLVSNLVSGVTRVIKSKKSGFTSTTFAQSGILKLCSRKILIYERNPSLPPNTHMKILPKGLDNISHLELTRYLYTFYELIKKSFADPKGPKGQLMDQLKIFLAAMVLSIKIRC